MKKEKSSSLKTYAIWGVSLTFLEALLSTYVTTPEWSLIIVLAILAIALLRHKL